MANRDGLQAVKQMFAFPFRDPQWKTKFLIGSGLVAAGMFFPLLPWLPLLGYCARVTRRAVGLDLRTKPVLPPEATEEQDPMASVSVAQSEILPEWDDWGGLFMDGLRQMGTTLLLTLPLIFLMLIGFGFYFANTMAITLSSSPDSKTGLAFLIGFFIFWLTFGLSFILIPVIYLLLPPAVAHVAVSRRFAAFFEIGKWFGLLRANLGGFIIILLLLGAVYTVMMFGFQIMYFTIVLCCFWPLLAAPFGFYVTLMLYHLSGLAYSEAVQPEGLKEAQTAG